MYPAFDAVANLQGEDEAHRSIHYALEAEKIHSRMYSNARGAVKRGQDMALKDVHICPVCGHTVEGEAPEKCPICGVSGSTFKRF